VGPHIHLMARIPRNPSPLGTTGNLLMLPGWKKVKVSRFSEWSQILRPIKGIFVMI
jgi:hypothetical protein